MADILEKLNININQNLWGAVVGLVALGTGEYYDLHKLTCFGLFLSGLMTLSLVVTTTRYTIMKYREKRFSFRGGWPTRVAHLCAFVFAKVGAEDSCSAGRPSHLGRLPLKYKRD